MSKSVSVLQGVSHKGGATITEAGLVGMVTLRADLSAPATRGAVEAAAGVDLPVPRSKTGDEHLRGVAWMSPDELLILCEYGLADNVVATLTDALGDAPHLAVNVSDARAVFTLEGRDVREVLGKLTPADLSALAPGEVRRSRLAQVPAAFWVNGRTHGVVICFRSVAQYAFDLLSNAATHGSEVGYY